MYVKIAGPSFALGWCRQRVVGWADFQLLGHLLLSNLV
jgi:hypothetical protein